MSFGPPIETLQDWNDRMSACGCCEIPVPAPTRDCQYVNLTQVGLCGTYGLSQTGMGGIPAGIIPAYAATTIYRRFVRINNIDTTNSGGTPCHWDRTTTLTYAPNYAAADNGACTTTTVVVENGTGCSFLGSSTASYSLAGSVNGFTATLRQINGLPHPTLNDVLEHIYSEPILDTLEWLAARGQSEFEYRGGWDAVSGITNACTYPSRLLVTQLIPDDRDLPAVITWTRQRFRWVIDNTFLGSYFKITWDVINVADAGGTSNHLVDQTWEWTGPGDPGDPDTWRSGWYDIDPPDFAGERRVANIRYTPFSGPTFLGDFPPDVTGEAIEPEAGAMAFDDENNSALITIL